MSEREATECSQHGEALRWSTDSEGEQTNDKPDQTTPQSDTTGSTPEMFKSPPEVTQDRVPGSIIDETTRMEQTVVQKTKAPRKYKEWVYIPETEVQELPYSKEARFKVIDPTAVLKAGLRTVRHHQFGWLAEDLNTCGELDGTKESLNNCLWSDYNAQLVHMRAMRDILGDDYDPLHVLAGRNNEGKFIVNKNVDVPRTI